MRHPSRNRLRQESRRCVFGWRSAGGGGWTAFALLLAGGVLYTVGAACFAMRWPNPWPKTFGHHEFFHAFTLLAALCQYVAIYVVLFH